MLDDSHGLIDLAVSDNSVCALDVQGITWCADADNPGLATVPGLPAIRFITRAHTGSLRYCALAVSDSTAWCWGSASPPAPVPGSSGLTLMHSGLSSAGQMYACGLRADSTAVCWGPAPLGDGTTNASTTPVSVGGGLHFQDLAVGDGFACGLTANGDVWCWGKDWVDEVTGPSAVLEPALATSGVSQLAADEIYVIALTGNGVVAWQGPGFDAAIPGSTDISGLAGLPVAFFALNSNTCLQLEDGQVYCWDEMWDRSSSLRYGVYTPVQPVPE